MAITNIHLVSFRSFNDQSFDFSGGVNIIIGPNAVGKTSLLESIYLIETGKTFRQDQNLIQEGKDWARIDMNTSDNKTKTIKITETGKTIETAEKNTNNVVLFEPNELFLFYQNPSERRAYIDQRISTNNPNHNKKLNKYKAVLFQRNNLLKTRRAITETLFVWNVKLAQLAQEIVIERQEYIDGLNREITDVYRQISSQKEKVEVEYYSKVPVNESYVSSLLKQLEANQEQDMATGYTNFGPHRDDVIFKILGKGVKNVASRGEIRTIMLALKKLEANQQNNPIILLDDVFSELDSLRRQKVVELFKDYQVFITTTEADLVINKLSSPHNTIVF